MPSIILLDTGPLSNSVVAYAKQGKVPNLSQQCRDWITDCELNGLALPVPAICYYEVLRELERRRAIGQIKRLQEFVFGVRDRFIPLTTAQLETAARLWGTARNAGRSMAADIALDADVILCAQALSLGLSASDYVVASTNIRHLTQFVPCAEWTSINP